MYDDSNILQDEDSERQRDRGGEPRPVRDVLAELLAQYQQRFPEIRITVVPTSAA